MQSVNKQLVLKPQDLLVSLKLAAIKQPNVSYAELAKELCMSVSEVHAAVKRAQISRLVMRVDEGLFSVRSSLLEFLLHGVRYSFPAVTGGLVRGMPTGFAGPILEKHFKTDGEISHVWPDAEGEVRGMSFQPLYPSVPNASRLDRRLYDLLTLVDALRGGAAREREIATEELMVRLA